MSWHTIPGHAPDLLVAVGWSPLLGSFFASVERVPEVPVDGSDDLLLLAGSGPGEITDLDRLAGLLEPHARLTDEMRATLVADRAAEGWTMPVARQGGSSARREDNHEP